MSRGSQLVGTWFRSSEGNFAGLEFLKDGNAILTYDFSGNTLVTVRYSVLEGGRLNLVAGSGETMIFPAVISGDELEISGGQMSGNGEVQRFRRLRSGQTLAQAFQEERAAQLKLQQERLAAIESILKRPTLAIVSSDPKLRLDRMALELMGSGSSWSGTGYVEGNVVVGRQLQLSVQTSASAAVAPQVILQFGAVVGPPGMKPLAAESMAFEVRGEPGKLELVSGARVLRSDAAAFADLTTRYKKTVAERQAAIAAFADRFGTFSRLTAVAAPSASTASQPRAATLGLLRLEGKPAFMWTDLRRDPNPPASAFNQPVSVIMDGDTLYLNFGPSVGLLEARNDGEKLLLVGQVQNVPATFELTEIWSKAQVIAQRARVSEFLDHTLASGVLLRGTWTESDVAGAPIRPYAFDLKSDNQRNLSGTVSALALGATFRASGKATDTFLGARLDIDASTILQDYSASLRGRGSVATLSLIWAGDQPVVTGSIAQSWQGNHLDLAVFTPALLKQDRDSLDNELVKGATFFARSDNFSSTTRPTSIELKNADGSLTASAVYPRKRPPTRAPLTATTEEKDGFIVFHLKEEASTPPGLPVGTINLWVLRQADGLLLSGFFDFDGWNPKTASSGQFRAPEQWTFRLGSAQEIADAAAAQAAAADEQAKLLAAKQAADAKAKAAYDAAAAKKAADREAALAAKTKAREDALAARKRAADAKAKP